VTIRLSRPGLHTLVADGGRPRTRSLGIPVGGPADAPSMAIANRFVGNPANCPALEITLAGPGLVTDHPVGLALFGSPFVIRRDGELISPGSSFTLKPGQTLDIGGAPTGCRAYLAVVGGFRVPEILGSRTGLAPLTAGAALPCDSSTIPGRTLPACTFPELTAILLEQPALEIPGVLRCLPGPQADWFDDSFWEREYQVSPAGNRMGVRLLGEPLNRQPGELVSEAVAPGAVQITNDGLPIVLGMDGQTIGGYPKVAHVLTDELPALGRLRPGEVIRFRKLNEVEAEELSRQFALRREALNQFLNRALGVSK
jgi:5-oxoprolinase (ATP-hydrolysing) subunit C